MSNLETKREKKIKDSHLDLDESVTYLIYRITNALISNFRGDLGPTKISIQEWRVLSSLKSRNGKSTISELSTCTIIKQPVISRIITEMQANGFVKKSQRKGDLRITDIKLTAKGNRLFEVIQPIAVKHREQALLDIDNKETDELKKTLKKMLKNLGVNPIN